MNPTCSIIMPCYNSSKWIEKSISSVLNQSFNDWELIIVDDCSSDNSVNIIEDYIFLDKRIKLIKSKKNNGAAQSRNIGISISHGRYIAFLDSDDLWHPKKLETQISFMQKSSLPFSFTYYEQINSKDEHIKYVFSPKILRYNDLLKTCYIGCLTVMFDTEYFGKREMSTRSLREDYATWLEMVKLVDNFHCIPEILASYRVYPEQNSSRKIRMAKENWHLYRNIENLNFLKAVYYFMHYAIIGLKRKYF